MSDIEQSPQKESNDAEEEEEILSVPPEDLADINDQEQKDKTMCDFIIKQVIGEGTFATVRLAVNKQTGEQVAIKIMEKNKIIQMEDKERIEREIKVLKNLRHPNIVHLYSVIEKDEKIYLITEYVKGKELFDYIVMKKKLSENESCLFFQQIISGIEYLHKLKYVHRDIKPENLLINEETKELKIVDFGLSNIVNNPSKDLLKSACGSPSYAAPEMLNGEKYRAPPVDIWSCGVVLYAMICGYLPFEDDDNDVLYDKICKGKFVIPNHVSEKARDLLNKILVTDPKKRFTINQIKSHPWFSTYNEKGKLMIREGLLLSKYVVPVDEDVVSSMSTKYNLSDEKIRISILTNKHDDISTIYYLLLHKKIRNKKKTVADIKGNLFRKYLDNKSNLFEAYDKDMNKVLEERKNGYTYNLQSFKSSRVLSYNLSNSQSNVDINENNNNKTGRKNLDNSKRVRFMSPENKNNNKENGIKKKNKTEKKKATKKFTKFKTNNVTFKTKASDPIKDKNEVNEKKQNNDKNLEEKEKEEKKDQEKKEKELPKKEETEDKIEEGTKDDKKEVKEEDKKEEKIIENENDKDKIKEEKKEDINENKNEDKKEEKIVENENNKVNEEKKEEKVIDNDNNKANENKKEEIKEEKKEEENREEKKDVEKKEDKKEEKEEGKKEEQKEEVKKEEVKKEEKKEEEKKEEKKEENEKTEEIPENKTLIKHREKKVHYEKNINKNKNKKTNIKNISTINNKGVSQGKNKIELKTSRIKSARTPLSLSVKVDVNKNEVESKELKEPLSQKPKINNKKHIKSKSTLIKEEMLENNNIASNKKEKEKLSTYKTPIKESYFSNKLNIKSKAIKPMEKMKTNNVLSERVDKKKKIFNKTGDYSNTQKEILLSEDTKKTKPKIKMGVIYEQQKSTNKSKKIKESLHINNISVDLTKKDLKPFTSYSKKVNSNKLVKNIDSQKNIQNKLMLYEQKNAPNFETQNSDATFSKIDEDSILISTKKLLSYEPFDLNLAYIKPRKVLKDELINLLDKNKIKYRNISNTRFVVELKKEKISLGVKFDKLNVINEENEPNDNNFRISIIKLRKLNGIYQSNIKTFEKIINKMN